MADLSTRDFANLARFRHAIRLLLRASEQAAREIGLTPNQHQLLLGVAGFVDQPYATVTELAEFLQLKHHSVVELIDRAEAAGLVRRRPNPNNRRQVHVSLAAEGNKKLKLLATAHRRELNGARRTLDLLDANERNHTNPPRAGKPRG